MPTVRGGRLPWWAMSTPLVDWLRAQDDDTLADLLRLRPDLAVPPPADLTVLATRAGIRASVHRACDDLDTVALHVLEALVVADADTAPVAPAEVRRLLGPDLPPAVLDEALAALRARALAWDAVDPDTSGTEWAGIALVPAVRDVVSRFPGGLGRPAAGVAASSALPELLAGVDPDERRVLETLAAGPPVGRSRGAGPANPVSRLLARGLLVRVDPETVELPRQVGLALRGDRPLGALALGPPDLATVDRGVGTVDGTAAGAALRALRQVEQLVAFWATTPPPALRSGGLGVRELRRAAREVDADETTAALLVEIAVAADLVGESDGVAPEWVPTTTADVWAAGGPEQKWAALARAWLDLPRVPGLVGTRDDAGRPIAALSDGPRRPTAPRDRRRVLAGLAELPPGTAVGDLRSARRPAGVAGAAAGRAAARRGRAVDLGRGDGAGRRRARRALDAGADPARPSRRAPPPPCAPRCPSPSATSCSRPTSRPSRRARSSPSWSTSWTSWARSSRRAGRPSTGSPRRRCAVPWTPGAPLPSCTSCSRRAPRRRCPRA